MTVKRAMIITSLLGLLGVAVFFCYQKMQIQVTVEKDIMHLLTVQSSGLYTLSDDANRMQCDLTTFSYLVYKMQGDGYVLSDVTESAECIEVFLNKDALAFRLHYDNKGNFISICQMYEKSYVPLTYLIE